MLIVWREHPPLRLLRYGETWVCFLLHIQYKNNSHLTVMPMMLPFEHNTCLDSDDFAEAQAFLNVRIDDREVRPLTAQGGRVNRMTLQPLRQTLLFGAHWGERVHIRSGAISTCHLVLPMSRSIQVRSLNRSVGPNEILLMLPGSEVDLIWDAGSTAIVVTFDSAALRESFGGDNSRIHSGVMKILRSDSREARALLSLMQCVSSQHSIHDGEFQPGVQRHWESLLIENLSDQLMGPVASRIDILPSNLRRAVDWLHANIEQPLTVPELVRVAQCSRRSLETGFQQFIGCSPARYILQKKLQLAHQRLQHAKGTVSETADQCGFNHLSHFTRLYKAEYGETPSQTLRRRTLVVRGS